MNFSEPSTEPRQEASNLPLLLASALFCALPVILWLYPSFQGISLWIGPAILLTFMTIGHMSAPSQAYPGVPHMIVLISLFQLVYGAWWSYYYPLTSMDIGTNLQNYLAYAVPFNLALAGGMFLGLFKLKPIPFQLDQTSDQTKNLELERILFAFIIGGSLLTLVLKYGPIPGSLHFPVLLLAGLRYVGAFGLLLLQGKQAIPKIGIVVFLELFTATNSAVFHHLAILCASLFVLTIFRFRLGFLKVLAVIVIAFCGLITLEYSKLELRKDIATSNEQITSNQQMNLLRWVSHLATGGGKLVSMDFDEKMLAHMSTRYNQGWLVNQVMLHVPTNEPYAKGKTVLTALSASLLPRFIAPDKYNAGGREYMIRYTGYTPSANTSMNIALAGEFYANFGNKGGIVCAAVYGLFLGLIIRIFHWLSQKHIVWWAFLPYVFFWTYKAEEGFGEILNWMTKSALIVFAITWMIPSLRANLWRLTSNATPTESDNELAR